MARLKLKSIYIRNFASIAETKLDFPETGLVLVVGQNDVGVNKFKSHSLSNQTPLLLGFAFNFKENIG